MAGNDWTFRDYEIDGDLSTTTDGRNFMTVHNNNGRVAFGWIAAGSIGRPDVTSVPPSKFTIINNDDAPTLNVFHLIHAPAGTGDYIRVTSYTAWNADVPTNMGDIMKLTSTGQLGLGVLTPARTLHINDTMRLNPRATAPGTPASGDLYVDSTPAADELCMYDGVGWQGLSSGTDANCS